MFGNFFEMLAMSVCTTRLWQTTGRLVQEWNVCTVSTLRKRGPSNITNVVERSVRRELLFRSTSMTISFQFLVKNEKSAFYKLKIS